MSNLTKVAIQGGRASFHDAAVRKAFPDRELEISECWTFRRQIQMLVEGDVTYALMAIENSLSGSILPNFALLERTPVTIIGEVYLQIVQNLMALPGQSLQQIEVVKSHPIALHQCSDFLEANPHLRVIESYDTAESAREIREQQQMGVAAIASAMAAELYHLDLLAPGIENIKDNYTRFLLLSSTKSAPEVSASANKASLSFSVMHKVGALAQVLNVFRDNGLNLGLIQSIPIPGRPDEYSFHVDVEWMEKADYDDAIKELGGLTRNLKILGEYKSGNKPYAHPAGRPA